MNRLLELVKGQYVKPEDIYDMEADIFSPCALGSVLNDKTIPQIKCEIIAGGANNQLENEEKHGNDLMDKGILYAPDYVVNAGGLINVANELEGYRQDRAVKQAEGIFDIVKQVFQLSKDENIPTNRASDKIAEKS